MQVRIGLYEDIVHRVTIPCKMLCINRFFITDAGYISKELEKAFDTDTRVILAIPRANMKNFSLTGRTQ